MKVTIALDPNIILAASLENSHYEGLLSDIQDSQDYIRFAVDDEGMILDAYLALQTNNTIHREIRDWLKQVIRQESRFVINLPTSTKTNKYAWLCSIGCGTPIEPQLLDICTEQGRDIRLIVVGKDMAHADFHPRRIHDQYVRQTIANNYPNAMIWDALRARRLLSDWLQSSPLPPHNQWELEEYLKERNYRESQTLEFKQPEESRDPTYVTKSILDAAMQELCGMANATGKGKVIVGIYEDKRSKLGEIRGFPPIYKNSKGKLKSKSEDELEIILVNDYLSKFEPKFGRDELQFEFFQVYGGWTSKRLALVLHLNLKSTLNCSFDGIKWIRERTEKKILR